MIDCSSESARKIMYIFEKAMRQVNSTAVGNEIYQEVSQQHMREFSDGWNEAVLWQIEHPDATIRDIIDAKTSILQKRYPRKYLYKTDANDTHDDVESRIAEKLPPMPTVGDLYRKEHNAENS